MRKVVIIGGVGYLGINLAYYHNKIADDVHVFTRYKTIIKRKNLFNLLYKMGSETHIFNNLYSKDAFAKLTSIAPDIVYITLGKLYGNCNDVYESNTSLPLRYISFLEKHGGDCLIIYMSHAFNYKDLSKYVVELDNNQFTLYTDRSIHPSYPGYLLNKIFYLSKYFSEKFIVSRFTKTYVFRAGLLLGMYPTHVEWRILNLLSRARLSIPLLSRLPITVAIDIAKVTDFIYKINNYLPKILLVCKYAPVVKELINLMKLCHLGRYKHELVSINSFGLHLSRSMLLGLNEYIYPYNLTVSGFDEWTPIEKGLKLLVKTVDINHVKL